MDKGWRPLWVLLPDLYEAKRKTFSSLLKPFSPGEPSEFPADFARFPLNRYSARGLVFKSDEPEKKLQELSDTNGFLEAWTKDARWQVARHRFP